MCTVGKEIDRRRRRMGSREWREGRIRRWWLQHVQRKGRGGEVDFQLETSDTDRKMRLACKKKVIEEI